MKTHLHDDWERLGGDFELDIAAGKVIVWNDDTKRRNVYRLPKVYIQLIQRAYDDGRKDRVPFQRV